MKKKIESGDLQSVTDIQKACSKFSAESNYKFCPGIDPQFYKSHYLENMQFNIKSVRQAVGPFARVDSVNCRQCSSWPAMLLVQRKVLGKCCALLVRDY